MAKKTTVIKSGLIKRELIDEDGDVVASYKLDPTDVKLAMRLEECSEFFEKFGKNLPKNSGLKELFEFNRQIEEKIDYILGKDASKSIFSEYSAVSFDDNGTMFIEKVYECLKKDLEGVLNSRAKAMSRRAEKLAKPYRKNKSKNVYTSN